MMTKADSVAVRVFNDLYDAIEGKPNTKGECFHLNMLSTTCHVYFGRQWEQHRMAVWQAERSLTVLLLLTEQTLTGICRYQVIR